MYKALALQVGQGGAELVGVEDEGGQVQIVLPDLEEGAQLQQRERGQHMRTLRPKSSDPQCRTLPKQHVELVITTRWQPKLSIIKM